MFNHKDVPLLKRLGLMNTDEDFREQVLNYARRKVVSIQELKRKAIEMQMCSDARKLGIKWNGDK